MFYPFIWPEKVQFTDLHAEGSDIRHNVLRSCAAFIRRGGVALLELTTIVVVVVSLGNCVLGNCVLRNRAAYMTDGVTLIELMTIVAIVGIPEKFS
jgi:hypothetical protein